MAGNERRTTEALAFLLGILMLGLGTTPARAQYGMGMGMGWGLFGFHQAPSPTDFLNQHALTRAAQGRPAPTSFRPYSNSPNAYFNRVRDNGFVSHYDVRRRQPPTYRPEPPRSLGTTVSAPAEP